MVSTVPSSFCRRCTVDEEIWCGNSAAEAVYSTSVTGIIDPNPETNLSPSIKVVGVQTKLRVKAMLF